ncbi:MAG: tRNA-intron lyase [DPANN group archaeon]|nr:tRNA-intron lyase [DPANN group archaeon]
MIKSHLNGNTVSITEDFQEAQALYDRSQFGEIKGKEKRLELALEEALYLLEQGKIEIYSSKTKLSFDAFVRRASKKEHNFWTRYRVYADMRSRGYIVKTGLKFGADFRVYDRGKKPGEAHAKWVLFATDESDKLAWRQFSAMNRVAHSTRKNLLIGIVDKESEVTFYESSWRKP